MSSSSGSPVVVDNVVETVISWLVVVTCVDVDVVGSVEDGATEVSSSFSQSTAILIIASMNFLTLTSFCFNKFSFARLVRVPMSSTGRLTLLAMYLTNFK